jgi:hypothetical protein
MIPFEAAAALVRLILPRSKELDWRMGTTGVLSIALSENVSINIFDHETAVDGAADYHSHWYDFRSVIIAGQLDHFRYCLGREGVPVMGQRAGMDHKPVGDPFQTCLTELAPESYLPGDSYVISAPEIHRVVAAPGTVTLVTRQHKTSPDSYCIFRRPGAIPRKAVPRSLDSFVELGLAGI